MLAKYLGIDIIGKQMKSPGTLRKVLIVPIMVLGLALGSSACSGASKPELKEIPVEGLKPTDDAKELDLVRWTIQPLQTPSGVENGFQFSIDGTDFSGSLTCPQEGGSVKGYVSEGTDVKEYTSKITDPCTDGVFDTEDLTPDIINGLSVLTHEVFEGNS